MKDKDGKANSFVLMNDWIPLIRILNKQETDDLFRAIVDLTQGVAVDISVYGSENLTSVWEFLYPKLARNHAEWLEQRAKRSEAGRKGGIASGKARQVTLKQNEAMLNDGETNVNDGEAKRSKRQANEAVTVTVPVTVTDTVSLTNNTNADINTNGELLVRDRGVGKEPTPKKKKFTPPTLDEVTAYITEKNLPVDPERFFDYYQSNGWRISGKTPMKDWEATLRNWGRRNSEQVEPKSTPHVFPAQASSSFSFFDID